MQELKFWLPTSKASVKEILTISASTFKEGFVIPRVGEEIEYGEVRYVVGSVLHHIKLDNEHGGHAVQTIHVYLKEDKK